MRSAGLGSWGGGLSAPRNAPRSNGSAASRPGRSPSGPAGAQGPAAAAPEDDAPSRRRRRGWALWLAALLSLGALLPRAEAAKLGVATPIENAAGLERWFGALKAAGGGTRLARALHYGDSTIAADGLARTMRARLAERFGDGGPGFVSAAFQPSVQVRSDVAFERRGGWTVRTILHGGAGGRYGLGGVVGVMNAGASVALGAIDALKAPRPQRRLEAWYQAGVGYGTFVAEVDGREVARASAIAAETEDRRFALDVPEGYARATLRAEGGPVPLYGVVLEQPSGITWEALGVVGVGSKSFTTFAREHLGVQMRERAPDLVVVQLGGNEVGYPSVTDGSGKLYAPIFSAALDTILAGAPDAACLVLTPLDQGELDEVDGLPRSKPGMKNLVPRQREVALARGCAFWDTRAAMGGQDAAARWGNTAGIGTGDYVHVTGRGLEILGNLLGDAVLGAYGEWSAAPGVAPSSSAATTPPPTPP